MGVALYGQLIVVQLLLNFLLEGYSILVILYFYHEEVWFRC
jgi:hypothetical protein